MFTVCLCSFYPKLALTVIMPKKIKIMQIINELSPNLLAIAEFCYKTR